MTPREELNACLEELDVAVEKGRRGPMVHWACQVSLVAAKLSNETLRSLATDLLIEDDGE